MKKVLYLTNLEVPYRVAFFNQLAKQCDLTVLYERKKSTRDAKWIGSEKINHTVMYLDGINIGNENSFSLKIAEIVRRKWDLVIVGCYNSKVQMFAMMVMRLFGIPFAINLDGEQFIGSGIKSSLKKMFLRGANAYLIAGHKTAENLKKALGVTKVYPYNFSSLTKKEVSENSGKYSRNNTVLVVGQYFDYKGMDVAYKTAALDTSIKYKFVGMGKRTELFIQEIGGETDNVEIIPFLEKSKLFEEYKNCAMLLLPTRQECWGLVINEAASFGMPIVSTIGSGAAVEFLSDEYPQFLAKPDSPEELLYCVRKCFDANRDEYGNFLIRKSKDYTIEENVIVHIDLLEKEYE